MDGNVTMNKNAGFTILEIVTVLIVIGIISAFAIGRGMTTNADLKVQLEVLKTQLRHAQARAMNSDIHWGIQTDATGDSYWLFSWNGSSLTKYKLPGEKSDTVNLSASGMSMTAGTYTYDSRGIPYVTGAAGTPPGTNLISAGSQTIVLSKGADSYSLTVTRNTGFVP